MNLLTVVISIQGDIGMSGRENLHYLYPLVLFEFSPYVCIIFKQKTS